MYEILKITDIETFMDVYIYRDVLQGISSNSFRQYRLAMEH